MEPDLFLKSNIPCPYNTDMYLAQDSFFNPYNFIDRFYSYKRNWYVCAFWEDNRWHLFYTLLNNIQKYKVQNHPSISIHKQFILQEKLVDWPESIIEDAISLPSLQLLLGSLIRNNNRYITNWLFILLCLNCYKPDQFLDDIITWELYRLLPSFFSQAYVELGPIPTNLNPLTEEETLKIEQIVSKVEELKDKGYNMRFCSTTQITNYIQILKKQSTAQTFKQYFSRYFQQKLPDGGLSCQESR